MPLLEVEGLVKIYGRRRVVNGVSFYVNAGEVVGLLGPNGAGKTTSFRMTIGMVQPYAGTVRFNGEEVTNGPMYKRAQAGMGYLSQEKSVFRKLSVEQNILAVLEAIPKLRSLDRRPNRQERYKLTDSMLKQFGLEKVRKNLASTLSGGETRRLEIARCLVCEPLLILLDEPFTGIDPITITDIQGIVRSLRDSGIALLITDHNVRETLKITDRSYVITEGTVEAHGTPEEIVRHPVVIAKYLGQGFAEDNLHLRQPPSSKRELDLEQLEAKLATPKPMPTPSGPPVVEIPATPSLRVVPTPSVPNISLQNVLQQERILQCIDQLKSGQRDEAERELLAMGRGAISYLIEALERRDLEIRRMAFHVLQRLLDGNGEFDPYAPEAHRRRQIDRLREQFLRKAG
jgi:lipopolysaccharide export system ATP-binding protein